MQKYDDTAAFKIIQETERIVSALVNSMPDEAFLLDVNPINHFNMMMATAEEQYAHANGYKGIAQLSEKTKAIAQLLRNTKRNSVDLPYEEFWAAPVVWDYRVGMTNERNPEEKPEDLAVELLRMADGPDGETLLAAGVYPLITHHIIRRAVSELVRNTDEDLPLKADILLSRLVHLTGEPEHAHRLMLGLAEQWEDEIYGIGDRLVEHQLDRRADIAGFPKRDLYDSTSLPRVEHFNTYAGQFDRIADLVPDPSEAKELAKIVSHFAEGFRVKPAQRNNYMSIAKIFAIAKFKPGDGDWREEREAIYRHITSGSIDRVYFESEPMEIDGRSYRVTVRDPILASDNAEEPEGDKGGVILKERAWIILQELTDNGWRTSPKGFRYDGDDEMAQLVTTNAKEIRDCWDWKKAEGEDSPVLAHLNKVIEAVPEQDAALVEPGM